MLFRSDPSELSQPAVFCLSASRQFTLEDDGLYLGMNEVGLSFEAPLDADLERLADMQEWGQSGEASATWIEIVERSEPFARLVQSGRLTRFFFGQGDM